MTAEHDEKMLRDVYAAGRDDAISLSSKPKLELIARIGELERRIADELEQDCRKLMADKAEMHEYVVELEAELEKARYSARNFCGAHVGIRQASCPVCELEEMWKRYGGLLHAISVAGMATYDTDAGPRLRPLYRDEARGETETGGEKRKNE